MSNRLSQDAGIRLHPGRGLQTAASERSHSPSNSILLSSCSLSHLSNTPKQGHLLQGSPLHTPATTKTHQTPPPNSKGSIEARRQANASKLDRFFASLGKAINQPLIWLHKSVFRRTGESIDRLFRPEPDRKLSKDGKTLLVQPAKQSLWSTIARVLSWTLLNIIFLGVSLPWIGTGFIINTTHQLLSLKTYTSLEGFMHMLSHLFIAPLTPVWAPFFYMYKALFQGTSTPRSDQAALKEYHRANFPASAVDATRFSLSSFWPDAGEMMIGNSVYSFGCEQQAYNAHEMIHIMQSRETPGWELSFVANNTAAQFAALFDSQRDAGQDPHRFNDYEYEAYFYDKGIDIRQGGLDKAKTKTVEACQ